MLRIEDNGFYFKKKLHDIMFFTIAFYGVLLVVQYKGI